MLLLSNWTQLSTAVLYRSVFNPLFMPVRLAGSPFTVCARLQSREPKTGQQMFNSIAKAIHLAHLVILFFYAALQKMWWLSGIQTDWAGHGFEPSAALTDDLRGCMVQCVPLWLRIHFCISIVHCLKTRPMINKLQLLIVDNINETYWSSKI